ncbi:unnamed protein product [Rangifer tarandus platyrhynchus]|uniref:Uncharacterized protein n=2 Tax=Rangifer tarandus platyrhynchus TaxID=3082113 RepID=A0ACB0E3H1_RANTA|nr:unnamed protein product [Rangifer tarandus platyrhynchus]CAI9694851.1 unnamed protein product [Rangifer tarandus platyrhynchus]
MGVLSHRCWQPRNSEEGSRALGTRLLEGTGLAAADPPEGQSDKAQEADRPGAGFRVEGGSRAQVSADGAASKLAGESPLPPLAFRSPSRACG